MSGARDVEGRDVAGGAAGTRTFSRREALRVCAAAGVAPLAAHTPVAAPTFGASGASGASGTSEAGGPIARLAEAAGEETETAGDEPPAWARFRDAWVFADVDGDGEAEELELRDRRLRVVKGDDVLLESDEDWQVSDVFADDFDRDGSPEVVFLLWRHGNLGSERLVWLEDGAATPDATAGFNVDAGLDDIPTQHLFVYRWQSDGLLHPVWMSSRLATDVARIEVAHPAALGGDTCLRLTSPEGDVTLWEWITWGFALVDDGDLASEGDSVNGGDTTDGDTGADADSVPTSPAAGDSAALSLIAVGDNIAHENVYEGAYVPATGSFDFSPCYEHVRDRIAEYDIAVVCQETVLVANPARRSSYPRFATPQSMGDALAGAGFDVVLGATNHVNDQGVEAIDETLAFWATEHPEVAVAGLHGDPADAGKPVYVERNGIRLALFDYTYGLNGNDPAPQESYRVDTLPDGGEDRLLAEVAEAAAPGGRVAEGEGGTENARGGGDGGADFVVCFLHVGEEYDPEPTTAQKDLAVRLIDAGAGAVVCSHTHVRGPWGSVRTASGNEGAVFWGLGNFLSGQLDDPETSRGEAAVLRFERAASGVRLADYRMLPLVCRADSATGLPAVFFEE